jgi:hypothetical protein
MLRLDRLLSSLLFLFALQVGSSLSLQAQIDTRFWFAAPEVTSGHGDDPIRLYLTAYSQEATVVISQPANNAFVPIVVTIPANTAQAVDLTGSKFEIETPKAINPASTADANWNYTVKHGTGILIEATAKISGYYEVNRTNNPDIFALKGSNGLGTDFYIPMQTDWNHQNNLTPNGHSGFIIVATEDNTLVTINNTKAIKGHAANSTFSIVLNKGETYCAAINQPSAGNAPFGSHVTSNKPIAVTVYHDSIRSGVGGCYDLAGDQIVPVNIIGTEYIVMRGTLGVPNYAQDEKVYILAVENGTIVNINRDGTPLAAVNLNQQQQHTLNMPMGSIRAYITSNKPIYVLHFSGYGCETGCALVPPIECTGSRRVNFIRSTSESFSLTLLVKDGFHDDFKINGTAVPASVFTFVPGTSNVWRSARITLDGTGPYATNTNNSIPVAGNVIENDSALFHMGLVNGGATSGCRYGYFSSFNTLNLGPDINIFYGTSVLLDGETFGALGYLWTPGGQTTPQITVQVQRTTNYQVAVNVGGCTLTSSICVGTIQYVWTGDQDDNWFNINNWSRPCGVNVLPDCNTDVVIPAQLEGIPVANFPLIRPDGFVSHPGAATGDAFVRNLTIEAGAQINLHPTLNSHLHVCGDYEQKGHIGMPVGTKIEFQGSADQFFRRANTATGEFANVIINNQDPTFPRVKVVGTSETNFLVAPYGTLHFQRGVLQTEGLKEVVVKNPAPNAITGYPLTNTTNDRFVAGRLRRSTNPLGSYDLPVGLATEDAGTPIVQAGYTGNFAGASNPATSFWQNNNFAACLGQTGNIVADFSGTNSNKHGQLPNSTIILGDNPRTIEMWVNVDGGLPPNTPIFQFGNPAVQNGAFCLRRNGDVNVGRFMLDFGGGIVTSYTNIAGSNIGWRHFAVTYDGSRVKVYMDGILRIDIAKSNLNTLLGVAYIGRYTAPNGTTNYYLRRQVDNVRIWNYSRSQSEIAASLCTTYGCTQPVGLIANYDFQEGTGTQFNYKVPFCGVTDFMYERANINFQTPLTDSDNLLAYFNRYVVTPAATGQVNICQADFDVCNALDHGFWNISSYNGTVKTSGNAYYIGTFYNSGYNPPPCGATEGQVMKRAINTDPWLIPVPGQCINNSLNATARGGMYGFSEFGIALSLDPIVLPVEWIEIQARPLSSHISVIWDLASEQDVARYEVLRSEDGQNFRFIGSVSADGSLRYSFLDQEVQAGIRYYYRIKEITSNGMEGSLSKIVSAELEGSQAAAFKVYPNPSEGLVYIDFVGSEWQNLPIQISLTNAVGASVMETAYELPSSNSQKTLSLEGLARGIYFLTLTTPLQRQTIKIQKQ